MYKDQLSVWISVFQEWRVGKVLFLSLLRMLDLFCLGSNIFIDQALYFSFLRASYRSCLLCFLGFFCGGGSGVEFSDSSITYI